MELTADCSKCAALCCVAMAFDKGDMFGCDKVAGEVCKHLDEHLEQLPEHDAKSRAILEQMRVDEQQHANSAMAAGGVRFPAPVKFGMTLLSKVMTKSTYRI